MKLHPDCEDRCQLLEHKGYHTCAYTGQCEELVATRIKLNYVEEEPTRAEMDAANLAAFRLHNKRTDK